MPLSDRTNLLITDYQNRAFPDLEESVTLYLQEELKNIEAAIASLSTAANDSLVVVAETAADKGS